MLKKIVVNMVAIAVALAAATSGAAEARHFDIPPGELAPALESLAKETGLELIFRPELLKGIQTRGVTGNLSPQEAVQRLISGTRLTLRIDAAGAILISDAATPETSSAADAAGEDAAPQTDASQKELSEVLVEGRKPFTDGNMDIVRSENDAQPYQIISGQEIRKSGSSNIETFLKKHLSMNTVAQNFSEHSFDSRSSQTNINLRGIGTNQTLILINGRRTSNISLLGETIQPDVKGIPIGAIERIEVLPVSSSAIYGGSAIGGVINVVLKRDFQGGRLDLSYRSPFDTGAPVRTVEAAYGFSLEGGRTNITIGGRYLDSGMLRNGARPELYGRGLRTILQNDPDSLLGSTLPYTGGTTPNIGSANGQSLVLKPEYGGMDLGSSITHIPTGVSAATPSAVLGAGLLDNAGSYNLTQGNTFSFEGGLLRPVVPELEAKSVIASLRRKMSDTVEAFIDVQGGENEMPSQVAFFNIFRYLVSASSPVNPFTQDVFVTVPAGQNAGDYLTGNKTARLTVGALAEMQNDWQLESDYTWSRNEYHFSTPLEAAFGPQGMPGAFASGALNPFVDTLTNPLDLSLYSGFAGSEQKGELANVALRAAGPVWRLPAGSPTLAIGLEYREERMGRGLLYRRYPNLPASDLNLEEVYLPQSQSVASLYSEIKIPLVSRSNSKPLVQELDLQLSARTEHFKVSTGTSFIDFYPGSPPPVIRSQEDVEYSSTNPTIGLRYKPVESIMLRASYATGFLPPDYVQFLEPTAQGTGGAAGQPVTVFDPRRDNEPIQTPFIAGGNPDIKPQSSKSLSLGVIWEPSFLRGMRANLEWYRLTLDDVALTPSAQEIVNLESRFPDRVTRAAPLPGESVGRIVNVDYSLLNAAVLKTEGIDLSLAYLFDAGTIGNFQFAMAATAIRSFERQISVDSPLMNIVNAVADGGPLDRKANLGLSWLRGGWRADWSMTYFGSYDQSTSVPRYVLAQGSDTVPSQSYHDVALEYSWPRGERSSGERGVLSGATLRLGVNNVFNKVPPFDAFYATTMYYSPFGDARLRQYSISVTKEF